MPITFDSLKALLIQARTEPAILKQEQNCFIERCQIRPDQLFPVNVVAEPLPADLFSDYNVLFIGGSGEFSAWENYEWMDALLDLVRQAEKWAFPTFGSCWGHQIIARALGGVVRYDGALTEMGCHAVELNEAGQSDPLFTHFPVQFMANMGHHDRVVKLPQSGIDLAFSATQVNQAFRIKDKPIYGTQFHSELDAERERERLYTYRALYPEIGSDANFQAILDGLLETTEVDELMHKFLLTYVVC